MSAPVLDRSQVPPRGALRPYHFPAVHRRRLANGLNILVAEMRQFPVVTADIVVNAGGLAEPAGLAGVGAMTSALLESGAGGRDVEEIAELVDALGMSLDAGVNWDTGQVGFTCLRARLEPAFELLADVVRRPTFPEDEVERVRDERLATIQQRRGTPSSVIEEAQNRWIYTPGSAFARPLGGMVRTVEQIHRGEVAAFHAAHYQPDGATLVAAGDVSVDEVVALAERFFGDWSGEGTPSPQADVRPRLDRTTVALVDRPGAVQSEIRIGHVGMERKAADFAQATVMNAILGGTFTSRLNLNLRERLGYTYGASTAFATRRQEGTFTMATAVQTEVTAHSVSEMLRDLREIREAPVTAAELEDARNFLAGVFPLGLQTTDGVSGKLTSITSYGLPDDYYDHYRDQLLAVTAEDVQDVAQRRLWPDRAAVVIVGDAEKIRGELEALDIGPIILSDPAELEA